MKKACNGKKKIKKKHTQNKKTNKNSVWPDDQIMFLSLENVIAIIQLKGALEINRFPS